MSKNRHKMAVAAHLLLENEEGNILFLRRANTGYADGQWSVPAGHVDPGETLSDACVREAIEELGVHLLQGDIRPVLVQHKRDTDLEERIDIFFTAVVPAGQVPTNGEPHKCDGLRWAPRDSPPAPLVEYVGAALVAMTNSGSFLAYFGFDHST